MRKVFCHVGLAILFGSLSFAMLSSCVTAPGRTSIPNGKAFGAGGSLGGMFFADRGGSRHFIPAGFTDVRYALPGSFEIGIQGLGIGYIEPFFMYKMENVFGSQLSLYPSFSIPLTYLLSEKIGTAVDLSFALSTSYMITKGESAYLSLNWNPTTQKSASSIFPHGAFPVAVTAGASLGNDEGNIFLEFTDIGFLRMDLVEFGGYHFW